MITLPKEFKAKCELFVYPDVAKIKLNDEPSKAEYYSQQKLTTIQIEDDRIIVIDPYVEFDQWEGPQISESRWSLQAHDIASGEIDSRMDLFLAPDEKHLVGYYEVWDENGQIGERGLMRYEIIRE
jgi:hypothetical protein